MRLVERAVPERLEDLVSLDRLTNDFKTWKAEGSYPQALIFHGPPGTGKTHTAVQILKMWVQSGAYQVVVVGACVCVRQALFVCVCVRARARMHVCIYVYMK